MRVAYTERLNCAAGYMSYIHWDIGLIVKPRTETNRKT
jgi:hypothetical protein